MTRNGPTHELWLDNQQLCRWIRSEFGLACRHATDLGMRQREDEEFFFAARKADAIVVSKDADFPRLVLRHGPPPKLIYITCKSTHNSVLRRILKDSLPNALAALSSGDSIVEIGGD